MTDSPSLAQLDSDTSERLYGRYALPRYSTSIAAAMEVVEKLRELDQDAEVEIVSAADAWGCTFAADRMDGAGFQQLGQSYDTSLPIAICRAALKAVGD